MAIPWDKHKSSDDGYGNYYTAQGSTPQQRYANFKAVKPPLSTWKYNCPADVNHGPFLAPGFPDELGPISTHRPWTPFAARNARPGALPLPLTISSMVEGFQFSIPPVFTYGGPKYWPTLPEKVGQTAVQYYGNAQNDFRIAPATQKNGGGDVYVPAQFPAPAETDNTTPYTRLEGFSDWAATASLTNSSGQSVAVTFATGSPLAFVNFNKDANYGCLLLSRLENAPPRTWYPEGYDCRRPSGVAIQISGASPVGEGNYELTVEIRVGQQSARASYPVKVKDTKESLAKGLQQALASNSDAKNLLVVGPVTASTPPRPAGDFEFYVSPKDRSIILKDEDVTVAPRADKQVILVPRTEPGPQDQLPANQRIIGITIFTDYEQSHEPNAPRAKHYASYALIAPPGGQWHFDADGRLVCDLTKAPAATKALIVCAMPTVESNSYEHYDSAAGDGAANLLRRFWEKMQPFAYGCPRHYGSGGKDDGTGTRLGPNDGNRFTPRVKTEQGKTTVTTEFWYNLSYPAGRPPTGDGGTLFCLFPHQWRSYANNTANILDTSPWELMYWTVVGPLRVAGGGGSTKDESKLAFTTTHTFPGMLAHLPNYAGLTGAEKFDVYDYPATKTGQVTHQTLASQMALDAPTPFWSADQSLDKTPRAFIPIPPNRQFRDCSDSYGWGKLVGLLGDLIPCAQDLKHTAAVNAAIRQINAQLAQWLSSGLVDAGDSTPFPPGVERWQKTERGLKTFAGKDGLLSNQQFLFYDQQWKGLIPYPTAYDADTQFNDHHFHYGYWIRAAAQLALAQARKLDPDNAAGTFIKNYGATVNLIIKDIANPLRNDTQGFVNARSFPSGPAMPFMRHFDGYSGHSWASGLEINVINQESVSEAMSAWTGVIMWGEVTNDTKMRDLGIWMYTLEMLSFYEYWTDCAEGRQDGSTYFPKGSLETVKDYRYDAAIKGGLSQSKTPRFFTHVYNGYRQLVTFFGWEPIFETGIQWLPFHGGSLYLNSSDAAIQWKLGWTWKWCFANSKFLWDNYNNKVPLVSLKQGIDAFVTELNASVNNNDPNKHATQGLRNLFEQIGYAVMPQSSEKPGDRLVVTKTDNSHWTVADTGEKTYLVERKPASLDFIGKVGAYRPTLFATTWEQIAWQALAVMDPNNDQVFWDDLKIGSGADIWAELAKAVGSKGDDITYGKGWMPLGGQAVSYSYYWIANACTLGVRDATASADYPFAVKFLGRKPSLSTPRPARYVVWNLSGASKTVTFSDGHKMTVDPYAYKVDPPRPNLAGDHAPFDAAAAVERRSPTPPPS